MKIMLIGKLFVHVFKFWYLPDIPCLNNKSLSLESIPMNFEAKPCKGFTNKHQIIIRTNANILFLKF